MLLKKQFSASATLLIALLFLCVMPSTGHAQVKRVPLPNGNTFPISEGVWAGDTYYLSGQMGLEKGKDPGDTKTQTIAAIKGIQKSLADQKLTLGDIVMMHVYLAPDAAKGSKLDFSGFMEGYTQFFGTPDQPNKPARSAMEVAALVVPAGLVEIEVIAVRH